MISDDIRRNATFLREAITYGILSPADAVAWADALIESKTNLPTAVFDLAVAPEKGKAAVLDQLSQLAEQSAITEPIAHALLDVLYRKVLNGSVTEDVAIAQAYRVTRALGLDSQICLDAYVLEEDYSRAKDGISGTVDDLNNDVRDWLASFRGSAANFYPNAA